MNKGQFSTVLHPLYSKKIRPCPRKRDEAFTVTPCYHPNFRPYRSEPSLFFNGEHRQHLNTPTYNAVLHCCCSKSELHNTRKIMRFQPTAQFSLNLHTGCYSLLSKHLEYFIFSLHRNNITLLFRFFKSFLNLQ